MRNTVGIAGIPVDNLDRNGVVARLEQFIQEQRFHQVATANTDFLINARYDPELRQILRQCDLVMPDGMPLVWASRLLKTPLPERVTGADIVTDLADLAARKGYTIYMLGGRPEVAQRARQRLEAAYPGLQIVGCVSPPLSPLMAMESDRLLDDIARTRPDILLVAFGNPKQEKWVSLHRDRLVVPVCIGIGGTFDFLAGETTRAPHWMQRSGLEWLYRLSQEPKRLWKRYANDIVYFARFLCAQLWATRGRRSRMEPTLETERRLDCTIIRARGPLTRHALDRVQALAEEGLAAQTHLVFDLHATTDVDNAILGTLVNLWKRAAFVGREVRLAGANARITRILRASQTDEVIALHPTLESALKETNASPLAVETETGIGRMQIRLCGRAEARCAGQVREALREAAGRTPYLEVNLQQVTYIDCGMLYALRSALQTARNATPEQCFLVSPGEAVMAVLQREKVETWFADFAAGSAAHAFARPPHGVEEARIPLQATKERP